MKIGILTTGHTPEALPEFGSYADMFKALLDGQGFEFVNFNVVDGEFPPDVTAADGWLITGSKHGAYDDHPWIAPLEAFIRAAFDADVPMVGVCFGHQIIAQALGGRVEKFAGGWSVGPTDYDFGGRTLALNAWHQDQVVDKPAGAKVVASSPFCDYAALVYDRRIFTVQPHPEFSAGFLGGLIEHRGGAVPDALLDSARDALERATDNAELARRIGQFFRERSLS